MNYLGSDGFGLVAGLALNLIYRRIQSEWPQSYFSLSDHWSYVKALVPSRYVLFRFGPVVLIGFFFSRQLADLGWPAWPFVAVAVAAHVGSTSLRAAWRMVRYQEAGERSSPLVVLHLATAAIVAACLTVGALIKTRLSDWIPDFESIRDAVWAGLIGSLLAFAFMRSTRVLEGTLADIVQDQRRRIGPALLEYARDLALHNGLDAELVETVILTESIERPRWFRRLERIKGIVFRRGTYGIMQVRSSRPIGDRRSIECALEMHRAAFELPSGATSGKRPASVSGRLRSYNGSRQFLRLAEDVYHEIVAPGHY